MKETILRSGIDRRTPVTASWRCFQSPIRAALNRLHVGPDSFELPIAIVE
jgi:hypothetical protein